MSALEHAREILEKAKENLEKEGHLLSVGILETEDESFVCPAPFRNDQEKKLYAAMFRQMAKKEQAQEFFFISEIWESKIRRNLDGSFLNVRPSDLPERREAILVSYETKNPCTYGWITQFFHKVDGKIVWGECEEVKDAQSSGLFTHILDADNLEEEFDVSRN